MQRTHFENMLNCFHLTTFAIMIFPTGVSHWEVPAQNSMVCAKLKQVAKGIMSHATYEIF